MYLWFWKVDLHIAQSNSIITPDVAPVVHTLVSWWASTGSFG